MSADLVVTIATSGGMFVGGLIAVTATYVCLKYR